MACNGCALHFFIKYDCVYEHAVQFARVHGNSQNAWPWKISLFWYATRFASETDGVVGAPEYERCIMVAWIIHQLALLHHYPQYSVAPSVLTRPGIRSDVNNSKMRMNSLAKYFIGPYALTLRIFFFFCKERLTLFNQTSLLVRGVMNCRSLQVTTHINLITRLRMSGAIPLPSLHAFLACTGYLPFTQHWRQNYA
jgi:hypothetical protein